MMDQVADAEHIIDIRFGQFVAPKKPNELHVNTSKPQNDSFMYKTSLFCRLVTISCPNPATLKLYTQRDI